MINKIAVCPKDKRHKRFVTVVHVTEDWVVDEHGDFIDFAKAQYPEVVAAPSPDNFWTCTVCGSEAEFVEKGK